MARSLVTKATLAILLTAVSVKGLAQCRNGEKLSDEQKLDVLKKPLDRQDRAAVECGFEFMDDLSRQGGSRIIPVLVRNLDLKQSSDDEIGIRRYSEYPAMDELPWFGENAEPPLLRALAQAAPDSIFSQNAVKALLALDQLYSPLDRLANQLIFLLIEHRHSPFTPPTPN